MLHRLNRWRRNSQPLMPVSEPLRKPPKRRRRKPPLLGRNAVRNRPLRRLRTLQHSFATLPNSDLHNPCLGAMGHCRVQGSRDPEVMHSAVCLPHPVKHQLRTSLPQMSSQRLLRLPAPRQTLLTNRSACHGISLRSLLRRTRNGEMEFPGYPLLRALAAARDNPAPLRPAPLRPRRDPLTPVSLESIAKRCVS